MPPVEPWIDNALAHHLPADFDSTRLIVPFTFDWGVCNTVLHDLWRVRDWSSVNERMERTSSWQPMGDLNSPCEWFPVSNPGPSLIIGYRIDQDVVIPARTCLQDKLRERFGNLNQVLPSRKRSILVAFKGSYNGAGSGLRRKLVCERPIPSKPRLTDAHRLHRYWNAYKPGGDYLETIGDTIFCPVPGGTTGWATRTIDVIYAYAKIMLSTSGPVLTVLGVVYQSHSVIRHIILSGMFSTGQSFPSIYPIIKSID
jgi:hypothetical protein